MADELHEAFLRLFTRCEPELRAFVRSCLPRLQDVDEVMQEVSLVAWRKFGDLDDRGRFAPWACLIARGGGTSQLETRRRRGQARTAASQRAVACWRGMRARRG